MRPKDIRPEDIAQAMGLSTDQVWAFARHIERCYKPRRMQWDGKKHRPIDPLHKRPKRRLRGLHSFLQRNRLHHRAAHGGVRRRSCFSSARVHVGRRYVWTRDAADCYPSISPGAMQRELRALGFCHDTAKLLTLLFTYRGGVPQGSPVSGDALNLFFWRIDQCMSSMAGSQGLRYSRVADDFVLSGKHKTMGERAVAKLERQLIDRGISVNEKKKKLIGLQTRSQQRLVHNISVSKPRGTAISRMHARDALALGDKYVSACRSLTADSIEAVAAKRLALTGWMHYCRQADFGPARAVKQRLDAGDRHVLRKLRANGLSSKKNKWWIVHHGRGRNEPRRLAAVWRKRMQLSEERQGTY